LEWGWNYEIGRRLHHRLLLHAGVLERDGACLILPALPGSGKSTLTAALSLRGWRLLSDEFGALDCERLLFEPVLKPAALKNQSIDVIRGFEPSAELGPSFPKTRKGTVAHLAPSAASVARRKEPAAPGLVLMPKWQADSPLLVERVPHGHAFSSLAFNAFNYHVLGAAGFKAVCTLADQVPAYGLRYTRLDDAIQTIDRLWQERSRPGALRAPSAVLPS
jgi:HprK-related kinase A